MIQLILCILILVSLIIYTKFTIENFYATTPAAGTAAEVEAVPGSGSGSGTVASILQTTQVPAPTFNSLIKSGDICNFNKEKQHSTNNMCMEDCIINPTCNNPDCENKCNNNNPQNLNNLTKSDSVNIRAFSGDKCIRLTWIKPKSIVDIEKYYIVLSSRTNNLLEVYILEDTTKELVEYYINNLDNDIIYYVYVIVKNKMGSISDESNTETVLTRRESELKLKRTNTIVSDSLHTSKNKNKSNIFQQPLYSKNIVYNDIIESLNNKLSFKPPQGIYNINIY